MTAAPNYIKTHSGKEHRGFSTVIEAMHQIKRAAIDLQRRLHDHRDGLRWRDGGGRTPRPDELKPSKPNSAGSPEAITEHQIHLPAAARRHAKTNERKWNTSGDAAGRVRCSGGHGKPADCICTASVLRGLNVRFPQSRMLAPHLLLNRT